MTESGLVRGKTYYNKSINVVYQGFKGIPYAEPPINELRFKAPVKHNGWKNIRDATEHGPNCQNSEDCLFLNVYTTSLVEKRPVMVFIHGGSFVAGSGDTFYYGPTYFMKENIVLVTINYRFGAFGFLSTGDEVLQGNNGLKDQVMALKWVKNNIEAFGGDVNSITIFGESAGSASVEYLTLSPLSKGLFNRAIAESGSVLSPWAFREDPKSIAISIANKLGLNTTDSTEILNGLLTKTRDEIIEAYPFETVISGLTFSPCVEAANSTEEIFLPEHPHDMLKSGNFNKVDFMAGFNDNEAITFLNIRKTVALIADGITVEDIPKSFHRSIPSAEAIKIALKLTKFYAKIDNPIQDISRFLTDSEFVFPIDMSIRYHASQQSQPVYYYLFSYDGSLNMAKKIAETDKYKGAGHADELFYMFDNKYVQAVNLTKEDGAGVMRNRMLRLWTNFAKYGNPTYVKDDIIDVSWEQVSGNQEFLELNEKLSPSNHPFAKRVAFWQDLYDKYGSK